MDEDLRARLARLDPVRSGLGESPTAHEIRERVMETINDTQAPTPLAPRRRAPLAVAAAAVAVAATVAGVAVLAGDDGAKPAPRTPTTLALNAPRSDVMSSCVMFDVAILRDMPVAFGGTAVAVGPESVTIDVDRWYKGGSADQVTIETPGVTTSVALDGVEFTQGARYLVTATNGTVNTCGFSGPASAELEQSFAEAFG